MLNEQIEVMVDNVNNVMREGIENSGKDYKEYLREVFNFIDEEEMYILKKIKKGEGLLDSIVEAFADYHQQEQKRLTFGELFEQILKKHDVEKNDFAKIVDVAPNSVYRWLRKKGDSLPDEKMFGIIIEKMREKIGVKNENLELLKLKYLFSKTDDLTKRNLKYIVNILDSLLTLKFEEENSIEKRISFDVYSINSSLETELDEVDVSFYNGYIQVISIMNSLINVITSDYEVLFIAPFKVDILDREVIVKVLEGMIKKIENFNVKENKTYSGGAVKHYFKLYEGTTEENIRINSEVLQYAAKLGMRHSNSYKPYYLLEKAENTLATSYFDNLILIRDENKKERFLIKFSSDLNKAKLFNFRRVDELGEARKEAAWDLEMCLRVETIAKKHSLFSSYNTNELVLEMFNYEQRCNKFYFLRYSMSCMFTRWNIIVKNEMMRKNVRDFEKVELDIISIIKKENSIEEKMLEISQIIIKYQLFDNLDQESFKVIIPMIMRQEMWFNRINRKEVEVHLISAYEGYEDFFNKKFLPDTGDFKYKFSTNEIQKFGNKIVTDYKDGKMENYKLKFIGKDALKLIPYIEEFDILLYEGHDECVLVIVPMINKYMNKDENDFPPQPYQNSLVIKQKDIVNAYKDYYLNVLCKISMNEKETIEMIRKNLLKVNEC